MAANNIGVIYIQRYKFQVYSPALQGVLEFVYVPELVKDMEVVNKDLFVNIVKIFIENNKIPVCNLIIVLSDNACFIKDFVGEDQEKLKVSAQMFADHTPFENVSSKTFSISNGIRVFATNKELYETIQEAFEGAKFTVEAVIPGFLMGEGVNTISDITPPTANLMVQKLNAVRQYSLLRPDMEFVKAEEKIAEANEEKSNFTISSGPSDKKRLFLLVGVFAVLIIALVVVYLINYPIHPK